MDVVRVICYYNGNWTIAEETGELVAYEGGDEKGLRLPKHTTLHELQYLASQLLGVDRDSHTIHMRYSAKESIRGTVKFIKIRDVIDLDFFLNQDSQTMVPLYVEAHAKPVMDSTHMPTSLPALRSSHCSNDMHESGTLKVSNTCAPSSKDGLPGIVPCVHSPPLPPATVRFTECMDDESRLGPASVVQSRPPSRQQVANEEAAAPTSAVTAPHGPLDLGGVPSHWSPAGEWPDPVVTDAQPTRPIQKRRKADSSPSFFQPSQILPATECIVDCAAITGSNGTVTRSAEVGGDGFFHTKSQLRRHLGLQAIIDNREYRVVRSTKTIFTQCCIHQGCPYWIRATRHTPSGIWKITKVVDKHTCGLKPGRKEHRQATPTVIGEFIKHKYVGVGRSYRPREIQADMHKKHGVNVCYKTCWRAREAALEMIRGSPEASYGLLPAYCYELQQKNPGTKTHILTDEDHNFLYFFMALGASIKGFVEHMRPTLSVDATFLKCKYRGTLLIAAALDGNNHIFPVAFGICDSENDASWEWFFGKLRDAIGNVPNLVVVSDRHDSIRKACYKAFPEAAYTNCIVHLKANIKRKFSLASNDPDLNLFISAANKYRQKSCLRLVRLMSEPVRKWITGEELGYAVWARSYCKFNRWDSMSTNIAESLNAKLKDARELPVTALVEYIRHTLQLWFFTHRSKSASSSMYLTPGRGESTLRRRMEESMRLTVHPINRTDFNVVEPSKSSSVCVNLERRTCSCREFDLEGLPCKHALAAARHREWSPYELCSRYYTNDTWHAAYATSINPVGQEDTWNVPDNVTSRVVLPPIMRPESGRPCKQRTISGGETKKRNKCSRCGEEGHNRATCKKPIPLSHRPGACTPLDSNVFRGLH